MPRSQFLLVFCLLATSAAAQTRPLFIPPTLEGPTYDLSLAPSSHEFFDGFQTATYGINGSYLGPTLLLTSGTDVQMNVTNGIGQTTTMHWHGMHVAPSDDGGPHTTILAGATWSPDFTVLDRATTFWYHPHLHEHTNEQVYRGLAGMIIVRDEEEAALDLPRTYGVDDFPLILQDREFSEGREFIFSDRGAGAGGDVMLINGTIEPYLEVGGQVIRFRVLNGSGARVYNLGLSDSRAFQQIGSDGGLLKAPVTLTRIRLAPGERAEVLVDFASDSGSEVTFRSFASELTNGEPGGNGQGGPGGPPNPLDGEDFDLIEIRVGTPGAGAVTDIPTQLVALERIPESDADRVRPMVLNGGQGRPFQINGVSMDLSVINEVVTLGDTEIWEITNDTQIAHPFHIHDVQFFILDRDGAPPAPNEQGLKDVVLVEPNETVRFITTFEDFADPEIPYMYHCHLLGHEDDGMMGQFLVVEGTGVDSEPVPELPRDVLTAVSYPNPFVGRATISYFIPEPGPVTIEVFDLLGRRVGNLLDGRRARGQYEIGWRPSNLPAGAYTVLIRTATSQTSAPVVLMR